MNIKNNGKTEQNVFHFFKIAEKSFMCNGNSCANKINFKS